MEGTAGPSTTFLEIDEEQAGVVRRIFREFANGLSSIAIATRLNEERIPGPLGGEWNASTIRGAGRSSSASSTTRCTAVSSSGSVVSGARTPTRKIKNDGTGYAMRANGSGLKCPTRALSTATAGRRCARRSKGAAAVRRLAHHRLLPGDVSICFRAPSRAPCAAPTSPSRGRTTIGAPARERAAHAIMPCQLAEPPSSRRSSP